MLVLRFLIIKALIFSGEILRLRKWFLEVFLFRLGRDRSLEF